MENLHFDQHIINFQAKNNKIGYTGPTPIHTHTSTHTYTHVHPNTHICTLMHTCMQAHVHTCHFHVCMHLKWSHTFQTVKCMYAFSLILIAVIKRWSPGITPVNQRMPSVRTRLLKVIMRNIT